MLLLSRIAGTLVVSFLLQTLVAQTALKTPDEFLPHHLGEQFTPHHLLTDYFEYLAAQAPQTMRLERYGRTYEARPLQIAIFSAPENMARLEEIRHNNLNIAGLENAANAARPASGGAPISIVWLSMSVHGNEPSGSECSMLLAWQLATQGDAQLRDWLKNTVVILDPSLNPDGYDRYTHWYRKASSRWPDAAPETREHLEPWPSGRTNHYHFDLNRDWAWATQDETRQRLEVYQRWLPHVHADLHEQYPENPYYFAPAAEPMHAYISPWQRSFQTEIGQNHARYFDQAGWLYFTKEVFDLFYPSYGDTYPMFNGAIGMTYEQAGHSVAGRAYRTGVGDTLRLRDRIEHHLTTSRSTIEMASKHANRLVQNFSDYYQRSAAQPPGKYKTFVLRGSNDLNKLQALTQLLDRHRIRYGLAGNSRSGLKAFSYGAGKETTVAIDANDVIISAYQPRSVLLEVLFEPDPHLSDSLTYDITAWALPYAYNLEAYALTERLEPRGPYQAYRAPAIKIASPPYAWIAHHGGLAEAAFVGDLLRAGVRVRVARGAFAMGDQQYAAGAYVITRADNRDGGDDFDKMVQAAAGRFNVALHAVFSGFSGRGADLGSESFAPLEAPNIALVYSDDVDDNSFGHTWYFFERELNYPVHALPLSRLGRLRLSDYTTIIFPHGSYSIPDNTLKSLQEWLRQGGRIIAFEGGVRVFADKDGFALKTKNDAKKDTSSSSEPRLYQARERDRISEGLPGAIVRTRVDTTHPLGAGLSGDYFSLKTSSDIFELGENATPVIWIEDKFQSYGFIGSRLRPRLAKTPVAAVQPMGSGEIIYFIDNPLFRAFWYEGKSLFANAVFH